MSCDAEAHRPTCAVADRTVYAENGATTFGFRVAPKSNPGYSGRYPESGSAQAYRVIAAAARGGGDISIFGEDLVLRDNTVYTFRATTDLSAHPLYLSATPRGASHAFQGRLVPGTLSGRGSSFSFNTRDLPDTSYAVCDHHPYMGFAVRVNR